MKAYAHRRLQTLSALFTGLMLAGAHFPACALTEGDYSYGVDNGTATITGFNTSYSGALAITNTLGCYPVTGIGGHAFESCGGLTSVIIPDSVIAVGESAFGGCVGLTNVKIGSRVADIGDGAFAGCRNLSRLTFPGSVTNIGNGLIASTGVTAIRLPYGITRIADSMFEHCEGLRSVIIPDTVTSIGRHAFCGCDLRSLVIPASVISIGDHALVNLKLARVYFKGDAPALGFGVFESFRSSTIVYYQPGTAGWGTTFGGCPTAPWVFQDPYEYTLDAGQVTISRYRGPGGAVTVPSELAGRPVVGIGAGAFQSCTGLVSVTLPAGISRVGDRAFLSCSRLKSVFCEGDAPVAGADVFLGADSVTVYRTQGTEGWNATFCGRPVAPLSFSYSIIDSAVTITGYSGVWGDVVIPETLEGLPVTSIGYAAFSKCEELTGITIPACVTNIGSFAFASCRNLADIKLPEGLISIGSCAFRSCRCQANVTIPFGVTSMGTGAFDGCDGIKSMYFEGDAPSLDSGWFCDAGSATIYYVWGTAGWGGAFSGCPTAVWTSTVTFDADGGNAEFESRAYDVYNAYGKLPTASRRGYAFGGWRTGPGGTGWLVTPSTAVTTLSDHTLYADWVKDDYVSAPEADAQLTNVGSCDGYFYSETAFGTGAVKAVRGTFSLKITGLAGKLTAKAAVQKGSLSFSATAWTSTEGGTCRALMTTRAGERLDLYVRQNRVWGTLEASGEILSLDGARNNFSNAKDAEAQAILNGFKGYYTLQLPVSDSVNAGCVEAAPAGVGYLTLTVGSGGSAKLAGVLADGTSVSQASRLIYFGDAGWACVPFFVPLYTRKGWAGGLMWIDGDKRVLVTDRDLGWYVRWEKPGAGPDGFSEILDACGGFYNTLPSLASQYLFGVDADIVPYYYTAGTSEWVTNALPEAVAVAVDGTRMTMAKGTAPVKVGGVYTYDGANSSLATLIFTVKTGVFKGKFNVYYDYDQSGKPQHKAVSVPYAGVLAPVRDQAFENLPQGLGHCLVPDNNPTVKAYKIKRSFPVMLDAE